MKKFLIWAVALLTAAELATTGKIAYASEQESLVIDVPEAYLQIGVPEEYDYVLDQKQSYRGDLDSAGVSTEAMFEYLEEIHTRVYALKLAGDYPIEAMLYYNPELKPETIKNLNAYSDKELSDLSYTAASVLMNDTKNYERVLASGDGAYRSPNGIAYYGVEGTFFEKTEEGTEMRNAYILYTFVDGESYTIFIRTLNPDYEPADLKETAHTFVDGITFYNAPTDAELEAEKAEFAAANEAIEQEEASDVQEEDDIDDKIANMYFMAGYAFVFIVIIAVIITIIAVNSSNKKKKQRMKYDLPD